MHMQHDNKDAAQSEATIPTIKPVRQKEMSGNGNEKPAGTAVEGHTIKRKPVSSSSSEGTIIRRPISEVSPPTPGVDDTPYIQFAIDQLTRDEEVVGPRRQSNGSEPPYPVERIIPNQYRDSRIRKPTIQRPMDHPQPSSKSVLAHGTSSLLT